MSITTMMQRCHSLVANGSAVHAIMPSSSFSHAPSAGPVELGNVDPIFLTAAVAAAALWNNYLPRRPGAQQRFNVTASPLPGNVVGEIWIPCGATCNVTIDPSYNAYTNVLLHEFGHGLGLPAGSVSTKYPGLTVDAEGNHWVPGDIDPNEIMTSILSPNPYLSKYTLDAISPHNHLGCYYDYECHEHECIGLSAYAPGKCADTLVYDGTAAAFLFVVFFLSILCITLIGISCISENRPPKYDPLGAL
ncbi:MAG: hypothetical protein CL678_01140 [Bdellovibrionaceae bacterium]|nr:hypothetical protein [Pseudobdellovibrionaceae bacterium]